MHDNSKYFNCGELIKPICTYEETSLDTKGIPIRERLFDILKNYNQFLLAGETLILQMDNRRIVLKNDGETLSMTKEYIK